MTLLDVIQEENEEINKHKYLRSKELGYDIGFEQALLEWVQQHQAKWLAEKEERLRAWMSADFATIWP